MTKKLFTIGELEKICGISKRTLRFYDQKGLIVPDTRNEQNNYRYYTEKNILDAIIVKELRKKGLKISEMKDVLKKRDLNHLKKILQDSIVSLKKEKLIVEKQLNYTIEKYNSILHYLPLYNYTKHSENSVQVQKKEATHVLFTKYISTTLATNLFWDRLVELNKLAEKYNVEITGPFSAIFHEHYFNQFFFNEGNLEVFFPIAPTTLKNDNIKFIDNITVISSIYTGKYENSLLTYNNLINYAETNKIKIIGPAIEEYLCDFSLGINEEDWITKISFPIQI